MTELEDCFKQVYRMARASWQSFTFWLYTRHEDPLHEDVLREYWHFFYATHEAHLTIMIISLDCLVDEKKPNYHNFESLLEHLRSKIDENTHQQLKGRVKELQKSSKGISIIRNHSFGHITKIDTRMAVGLKHEPTQGELMIICYQAMALAIKIGQLINEPNIDKSPEEIREKDLKDINAIYEKLKPEAKGNQAQK